MRNNAKQCAFCWKLAQNRALTRKCERMRMHARTRLARGALGVCLNLDDPVDMYMSILKKKPHLLDLVWLYWMVRSRSLQNVLFTVYQYSQVFQV